MKVRFSVRYTVWVEIPEASLLLHYSSRSMVSEIAETCKSLGFPNSANNDGNKIIKPSPDYCAWTPTSTSIEARGIPAARIKDMAKQSWNNILRHERVSNVWNPDHPRKVLIKATEAESKTITFQCMWPAAWCSLMTMRRRTLHCLHGRIRDKQLFTGSGLNSISP